MMQVSHLSMEYLFTPAMEDVEAKLSVMQATYLIIQASGNTTTGLQLHRWFKQLNLVIISWSQVFCLI